MTRKASGVLQLQLFGDDTDIEAQVQAILARRRATNSSGQSGEDIDLIRGYLAKRRP